MRATLVAAALTVQTSACAKTGRVSPNTRRPSRSANILTASEIAERAASATTAEEAVMRLRVDWLRISGVRSFNTGTPIRLYVNNTPRGNVDGLATIPVELVGEIRRYSASEATARWGTGHTTGAIEVVLGRGQSPETHPVPLHPDLSSSSSREPRSSDQPTEKREGWLPTVLADTARSNLGR